MSDDAPPLHSPVSNIPEYTVSEIAGAVKRTLEGEFGRVRVRGEITELKRYPSGHIYFSLKDEGAKLAGVIWKFAVPRLGLAPENGVEVIATGKISSYAERSSYQLIVERLDYAGVGALLARIEALRGRLAAEGLFEAARKRPLPLLPRVIGVITSERGAVIQDIRTTLTRRFPRTILLWPVPVQGEGAAERIAAAIAGFGALPESGPIPRPDVLIVARGGGSLEDLMAFNDEAVVRAAANCPIPLISAVGHETDTTLIDFAADRRAPTPTAAAEMAVPARADLLADLAQKSARLAGAIERRRQAARLRLNAVAAALPDLPSLAGAARQRLDDRMERLKRALPALLVHHQNALRLASSRLNAALRHFALRQRGRAERIIARLTTAPLAASLREQRAHLAGLAARLLSVSHHAVLARGYALLRDPRGEPLTSAAAVRPGSRITIEMHDGNLRARTESAPAQQAELPLGD